MSSENQDGNMQIQALRQQQQQLQEQQMALHSFWQKQNDEIANINPKNFDFRGSILPLARIKKIMKIDEDVKMISAEAPILFAKACEMFILELSLRAWIHTEENKRRTLQRSDIATAITKTDVFDFLIDIVPRDEVKPSAKKAVGMMDQQMLYQQQLQQQQAAMFQQYMQSGGAGMSWPPQMQAFAQAQQGSTGDRGTTVDV